MVSLAVNVGRKSTIAALTLVRMEGPASTTPQDSYANVKMVSLAMNAGRNSTIVTLNLVRMVEHAPMNRQGLSVIVQKVGKDNYAQNRVPLPARMFRVGMELLALTSPLE